MKNLLKVMVTLSALASIHAFADCGTAAIDGTWTRSESYAEGVDSGKTWTYHFRGSSVKETIALTDNLTATGTYGPYFAQEIDLIAIFGTNCSIKLTETNSVSRSYRIYDEPTADVSVNSEENSGRVSRFSVSVAGDEMTMTDLKNNTVRLRRKN
jgi:opacity protein-like surface antigen